MYLMYVDESGDPGMKNSPSRYFILTGLVVHELNQQACLDQLIAFRRRIRDSFGLKLRQEIHAYDFVSRHPGELSTIKKNDRLSIIRFFARELSSMPDLNIINVVVDKSERTEDYDPFDHAWTVLIQRFENTISYRNFSGARNSDDRGLILADRGEDLKLTRLLRRMRRYNPIPNRLAVGSGYRNLVISKIIEDPIFKDSRDSYFIQACDLAAFLMKQYIDPNTYMRKKAADRYWLLLDPILCKAASKEDPHGVVRL